MSKCRWRQVGGEGEQKSKYYALSFCKSSSCRPMNMNVKYWSFTCQMRKSKYERWLVGKLITEQKVNCCFVMSGFVVWQKSKIRQKGENLIRLPGKWNKIDDY